MRFPLLLVLTLFLTPSVCQRSSAEAAREHYDRGEARFDQADLKGALADYNKAIELDPTHAYAYNNRGNVKVSG